MVHFIDKELFLGNDSLDRLIVAKSTAALSSVLTSQLCKD